jgi:signal transduction histidine kinase
MITHQQHAVWRQGPAEESHRPNGFYKSLIAMTGHDLRRPLQIIVSVNSVLSRQFSGIPEREHLARSQTASFELMRQLDRLIDAIRVHERAETIELQPVKIGELLESLAREHNGAAQAAGLTLRVVNSRALAMSDSVLLEGILRNLIKNAIKYTPSGGKILVGCRRVSTGIRIEVHDTGIGIAESNMYKIFNAFERLESGVPEGLGLGLFIVRHAAASLGHRVDVRSTEGKGSCFSVEIDAP